MSNEWISVEATKPNEGDRVLLIVNSLGQQYVCIGKYSGNNFFRKDKGTKNAPMEVVTHWQPLPELPK